MSLALGTRIALLVFMGCVLVSCKTTTTPQTDAAAAVEPTTNAALAEKLGLECEDAAQGEGCLQGNLDVGDYYDVALSPGCGRDGQFASAIGDKNVELLDKLPVTASHAKVIGHAEKGRLLCIQAIAYVNQHVSYYYVVAISKSTRACPIGARNHVDGCDRGWALADELAVSAVTAPILLERRTVQSIPHSSTAQNPPTPEVKSWKLSTSTGVDGTYRIHVLGEAGKEIQTLDGPEGNPPYQAAALLKLEDFTGDGKPDILARGLSAGASALRSESIYVFDDKSGRFLDAEPFENDGEVTQSGQGCIAVEHRNADNMSYSKDRYCWQGKWIFQGNED